MSVYVFKVEVAVVHATERTEFMRNKNYQRFRFSLELFLNFFIVVVIFYFIFIE